MDEDNNSNPPLNRPFRVRRPSSSLISSTTSPIFPVPPNPLLRSSINRSSPGGSSSLHRQRDTDEDMEPSSPTPSSSSSFTARASRQRAGFSYSSNNANFSGNNNNNRSSSPLGSPDSTFWGPSQSPGPVNSNLYRSNTNSSSNINNSSNGNSSGGPPTPGGMCVVSSSTVEDDIPPSPFSPPPSVEDNNDTVRQNILSNRNIINNSNSNSTLVPTTTTNAISNSVSVISGNNNNSNSNNNGNQDSAVIVRQHESVNSAGHLSSPLLQGAIGRSIENSPRESSSTNGQYSNFSSPSSSYLSPLSKKIKKASSFERFSAQAQASINNNNNSINVATNSSTSQENVVSRINITNSGATTRYSLSQTNPPASTIPGPSRLMWECLPSTTSTTTNNNNNVANSNESSSSSTFTKSTSVINTTITSSNTGSSNSNNNNLQQDLATSTIPSTTAPTIPLQYNKPFLIKKFAAKIASALEQKQLIDDSNSTVQFPSIRNSFNLQGIADEILNENLPLNEVNPHNTPLNLTEHSASATSVVRNPIVKTFSKKIPMPPKQKILQRMQSGEIFDGLSPPPPPIPHSSLAPSITLSSQASASSSRHSPPPMSSSQFQLQQSQLVQQEPQDLPPIQQQHQQSGLIENMSSQFQHSSQPLLERYAFDGFSRGAGGNTSGGSDDFSNVQDALMKSSIDCSNSDPNIQVLYDDVADAYAYYYGNILGDEIFSSTTGGNTVPSSRPLLMNNNMALQDEIGNIFQQSSQQHGHLEFAVGMNQQNAGSESDDSLHQPQQHDRIMAGSRVVDELQLDDVDGGNGGSSTQHAQFLDPNETNNSLAKLQNDSTLRNLLMNQPLRIHDDSWISASNEFQVNQNSFRGLNSNGGLATNSILGNALLMNMIGNNNSSNSSSNANSASGNFLNDWQPRALWQHMQHYPQQHQQTDEDSGGDQDEVMDMSVMDIDKSHNMNSSSPIIIKRVVHNHALVDHNGAENLSLEDVDLISERELVTSGVGLPPLHGIPLDLQLQQQPLSLNVFSKAQSSLADPSSQSDQSFLKNHLSIDPQQHHRSMSMDNDEPVNLIASANSEQEFAHQNQHHHHHNNNHHINEGNTSCIVTTQDPNSSCITIMTTSSSTTLTTAPAGSFGNGFDDNLSGSPEEKRIIRFKKAKEPMSISSEIFNTKQNGNSSIISVSPTTANFIPDKPVQPKAFGSLPSPLALVRDIDNSWRVFNRNKIIPCNTRFGPVEGPMKKVYEEDFLNLTTSVYPYLVMVDESNILWHLDRTHDELCNWMKFIRLANSREDQNALISECNDSIYFTTCKDILPKMEIRVGYSLEYAEKYGFPYIEPAPEDYSTSQNDHADAMEIEYETQSVLTVGKQQKPQAGTKVMEIFQCFECDIEFTKSEDLNKHLNTFHDDEPDDLIRRPKKKVLKKYNSENINPATDKTVISSVSATPTTTTSTIIIKTSSSPSVGTNDIAKEVIGSKYEKFPRKKAAMENALVQDSTSSSSLTGNTSSSIDANNKALVASSVITTTALSTSATNIKKKNKCAICYKTFANKDRLERHMIVHSDEECKPLKCSSCSKRFLTNSALVGHEKIHAEEGKYFECPLCEFSTQQLLQLKEHVQTHKSTVTGMFHCHRCTKKFSLYAMVRKHIRAFHGAKMFTCDYEQCSMTFPTSDKLKLHKLKHSDHREFLCAECGRQFKRRDKLVEHTKRMHSETKKKPVEIVIATPAPVFRKPRIHKKLIPKLSPEEFEKFTYRCSECVIGFKRRGMLVNHYLKRHPEKTPQQVPELNMPILKTTRNYFCLYCERVYKSSSKRKSHILKSHPGKALPPQLRGKVVVKTKSDQDTLKPEMRGENIGSRNENESFVSSDENGVSASGIQLKRMSLFNDAGKVVATPHACQWCYRQYATRAKLLQHQRKSHLHLMPPEMQKPRAQKNNVQKTSQHSEVLSPNSTSAQSLSASKPQPSHQVAKVQFIGDKNEIQQGQVLQFQHATLQKSNGSDSQESLSQVSGSDEVIGFFLTTNITNGELNSLLQQSPELVVVPMTSLPSTLNNEAIASITSTTNLSLTPLSTSSNINTPRVATTNSSHGSRHNEFQNLSQNTTNNNLINLTISTNELNVSSGNPILTKTAD